MCKAHNINDLTQLINKSMKILAGIVITLFIILAVPYFYKTLQLKILTKSDLPKEGNWANLSEGNIYYQWYNPKIEANGEIIILVHGFSTPSFVWKGMLEELQFSGFKILTYDHFGRGFSERPITDYTKDFYISTLNELLDHEAVKEPVHLVGYSMGGPIIGFYANQYPNRVRSLSLIAPAGFSSPDAAASTNSIMYYPIIGEWFFNVFRERFKNMLMPESEGSEDSRAITQEEYQILFNEQFQYKGYIEALLSTLRNFNLFSVLEMYSSIGQTQKPVLAIWGKLDGVVPFSGSEILKQAIPRAELVVIEEGTHDITYRQPSQVSKAIVNFLLKQKS